MPFRCNCGKLSCSQRMIPNCHKSATFILNLFCPRTKNQSQPVRTTIAVMSSSRPWWVCTTFSFRKRAPTKICDVFRISSVSIIHQPGTSPSRNAQFKRIKPEQTVAQECNTAAHISLAYKPVARDPKKA